MMFISHIQYRIWVFLRWSAIREVYSTHLEGERTALKMHIMMTMRCHSLIQHGCTRTHTIEQKECQN